MLRQIDCVLIMFLGANQSARWIISFHPRTALGGPCMSSSYFSASGEETVAQRDLLSGRAGVRSLVPSCPNVACCPESVLSSGQWPHHASTITSHWTQLLLCFPRHSRLSRTHSLVLTPAPPSPLVCFFISSLTTGGRVCCVRLPPAPVILEVSIRPFRPSVPRPPGPGRCSTPTGGVKCWPRPLNETRQVLQEPLLHGNFSIR